MNDARISDHSAWAARGIWTKAYDCALEEITTLRQQLAEVQADLAFMTENRNIWQDSATQRWFRIEEANARADRAEAALAAQIEADTWKPIETAPRDGTWFVARTGFGTTRVVHYADCSDRYPISHDGVVWSTAPTEWMAIAIRAQPHDRTALDRALEAAREETALKMVDVVAVAAREARDKALREAAFVVRPFADGSGKVATALHAAADAIEAMIEQPAPETPITSGGAA